MDIMNSRDAVKASVGLFSKQHRRRLVVAVALGMATSILDVVGVLLLGLVATLGTAILGRTDPPAIITSVVQAVGLGSQSHGAVLSTIALAASALLLAKSVITVYINHRILRFLANRQTEVSWTLTRAVLSRPLLEIQKRSSHTLTYSLTDGVSIAIITVLSSTVVVLTEVAMLLVLSVTLLLLNPLVTLGAVAFFGSLVLFMQHFFGHRMNRTGRVTASSAVASRTLIQEALGTYREILVLDRREDYATRVTNFRRENAVATAEAALTNLLPKYILEAALVVGALVLAGTQFMFRDAAAAIGTVTLFLAASTRVLPSILRLQQAVLTLRSAAGGAEPTYELAAELRGREGRPLRLRTGSQAGRFQGSIEVKGVSLTYPGSAAAALTDISFRAPAGSAVALIGPSGAGKSTMADVMIGALDPDHGSVRIGGVSPKQAIGNWPGSIGYVPQRTYLADSTIRENVALGLAPEAINPADVWRALDRSQLGDFVRSLPDQLDTRVGENGARLSGGQQQRLGLARALYTEPSVLLLDEATSSLDTETEHAITETLGSLQGQVTTVIIAHRLSTVRFCDLVLYFDCGRLIATGSFDEVRAAVPRLERQAQLSGL